MEALKLFRLIGYIYIVCGMAILAWEMGKSRHELARGFTLLLIGVGINSGVWLFMLALSILDLNTSGVFAEWMRVMNVAFLGLIVTFLLIIFKRMTKRTG